MPKAGRSLLLVCIGLGLTSVGPTTGFAKPMRFLFGCTDCEHVVRCQFRSTQPQRKAEQTGESTESSALFYAAGSGDYSKVESLINAGFDVNRRDEDGMTPLFPAAKNGKSTPAIVRLLVKAGCDVNLQDKAGETALLYSIDPGGALENIKALLDAGADVNIPSIVGETPLMRASDWGSVNIINMLLTKGAKPDLKRENGRTALMIAAEDGEYNAVVLLISHNANPNLRDSSGKNALRLAIDNYRHRRMMNRHTRDRFSQTINLLSRVTGKRVHRPRGWTTQRS